MVLVWAALTHYLVAQIGYGWPSIVADTINLIKISSSNPSFSAIPAWDSNYLLQALVQWLACSPLILAPPIVLLAAFELRHRNMFEDEMTRAIGEEDLRDIEGYYSIPSLDDPAKNKDNQGGRKGFWVLEYDKRIIGAMGLDGRRPKDHLDSFVDIDVPDPRTTSKNDIKKAVTTQIQEKKASPPSSSTEIPTTLFLRRFGTSLSFRTADIEDDLLQFVSSYAFSKPSSPIPPASRIIITLRPSVQGSTVKRVKKAGFKELQKGSKDEFDMERWKKEASSKKKPGKLGKFLESIWPLDLSWKTYALDRSDWEKLETSK